MKRLIIPFEENKVKKTIALAWISIFFLSWTYYSLVSETHIFPSFGDVLEGFRDLYKEGLIVHIFRSLGLFIKSALVSIIFSLAIVYVSPFPLFEPMSKWASMLRFLPLAGLSYYMAMAVSDARIGQVAILSIFVTTFLVTSILSLLKGIDEEIDHAKTLGCTKKQILFEVIIKGKIDYVIDSVRQNLAIIWMSIVMVESMVTSYGGLGFLIKNGERAGSYGRMVALQIIILLVGLFLDFSINKCRKIFYRYSNF